MISLDAFTCAGEVPDEIDRLPPVLPTLSAHVRTDERGKTGVTD